MTTATMPPDSRFSRWFETIRTPLNTAMIGFVLLTGALVLFGVFPSPGDRVTYALVMCLFAGTFANHEYDRITMRRMDLFSKQIGLLVEATTTTTREIH
jgi:hypothetical protein